MITSFNNKCFLALWIALFLLLTSITPLMAQEDPSGEKDVPQTLEQLEERIKEVLAKTNTPGAAVVLASKEEVFWVGALGMADLKEKRPVTQETMFRVGSISKSFVGLTLLELQERGVLSLDDPLQELVPDFFPENPWEDTNPLLLSHLLEHTAGFDDMSFREYVLSEPDITLEEAFQVNPRTMELRWPPGKHASYSNVGPSVAAYSVEKASGQNFEDLVQESLLDPLEMETASFFYTPTVQERVTKSYEPDGVSEMPYSHIIYRPSGSLNVTPREMGNLIQMLLNEGTFQGQAVLTPESVQRFETPETALSAREGLQMGYGPGSFKTPREGFVFVGHDGGIDGFISSFGYLPQEGLGYFCSINSANGRAIGEIISLIQGYLTRDLDRPTPPQGVELAPEEMDRYTGYYETFTPRTELSRFLEVILGLTRLEEEEGMLYIKPLMGGAKELVPLGDGVFRGSEEPVATTVFIQEEGDMILQGYGGPASVNLRSLSPWKYWARLGLTVFSFFMMASSLLFALVWVPLAVLKKRDMHRYMSLRLLPVLPTLTFLALSFLLILSTLAGGDPIQQFGNLTIWSGGIFILTLLFGLTSLAGLVQTIRAWGWQVNNFIWFHSLLVSLGNMTATLFLAYWGVIGFRIWA